LRIEEPAAADAGVDVLYVLAQGQASVVRSNESDKWLALAAETIVPDTAPSYSLSQRASLVVEVGVGGVVFATRRGEARVFRGPVPEGALIDESGKPVDRPSVRLPEGHRLVAHGPFEPTADEDARVVVPAPLSERVSRFALAQCYRWLQEAEKGDLIPVRGGSRAAPGVLGAQMEPSLAFDQPRPVAVSSAPRAVTSPVRTSMSPAQTLVESGVPGTVIAGQRFRRSRIIGNPATSASGTGALTVNRAAELLVRLDRN
jgi:hypothetical protein